MPRSYTTWERLDPLSRNPALTRTLRMELADPLWLLARQRQFGEFTGEDAGSPVDVSITLRQDSMTRVALGNAEPEDYDPVRDPPLETLIEREPVAAQAGDGPPAHLRAEAGMHFLSRLHHELAEKLSSDDPHLPGPTDFGADYHFGRPDVADSEGRQYCSVLDRGRALDGHELYRAFHQDGPDAAVPEGFDERTEEWKNIYRGAVNGFAEWYESLVSEPPASARDAWNPQRMEYEARVSTGVGSAEVVFEAGEYRGGRLDWYDFDARPGESLEASGDAASPQTIRRQPTRASFRGMAAPRLWEMEDSSINLSAISAAGDDLSRLLLLEFTLIRGNDWFTLPLEAPIGTLTCIDKLTVTDTFDRQTTIEATESRQSAWRMYTFDTPGPGLLLPPVLGSTLHGEVVERVVFGRDGMANLLFAVEELFEGPLGEPVDRDVFTLPKLTITGIHPAERAEEEYVELHNKGDDELSLEGWKLVMSEASASYPFPDVTLPPRGTLRVVVGGDSASDTSTRLHAGEADPVLKDGTTVQINNKDGDLVLKEPVTRKELEGLDRYRLVNELPDHWFPYVLKEKDGAYRFKPALMLDSEALSGSVNALPRPLGRVLKSGSELYEEEVTRSGVSVTRRYQLTSWLDGSSHLWSGHRVRPGRGEVSSGLRFDSLERSGRE